MRDAKPYGVPFAWGSLPLVYDAGAFPKRPGQLGRDVGCRMRPAMIALDNANNWIVNSAIVLGFDKPYDLSDEQFAPVKAKLIEQNNAADVPTPASRKG